MDMLPRYLLSLIFIFMWKSTTQTQTCFSHSDENLLETIRSSLQKLEASMKAKHQSFCPRGWEEFQGHCYSFNAERKNWNDAEVECRRSGGYLVQIEDSKENDWIKSQAKAKSLFHPWIGLYKYTDKWKWVIDLKESSFFDWNKSTNEPNNTDAFCGSLHSDLQYNWNDNYCSTLTAYICERNLTGQCLPYSMNNRK